MVNARSASLEKSQPQSVAMGGSGGDPKESQSGPTKGSDPKYKIQIGLNPKQKEVLFSLRDATGVDTAAQVVRDALRVYEFLVDELSSGDAQLLIENSSDGSICRVKLL